MVDTYDWTVGAVRAALRLPPFPPDIIHLGFDGPLTVRVATPLRFHTRRAGRLNLCVEQDQLTLFEGTVARNGRTGIMPLTGALVHVRLQVESRDPSACRGVSFETFCEPLPNGPAVEQFDVAAEAPLGGSVACAWHAPAAERVDLAVIEDGNIAVHSGPPSGQMLISPTQPGLLMLRLTAASEWGQTIVTRAIEITAPPLRITLPHPEVQAGHPGDEVRFAWQVTGADSVWLVGPDSHAPQPVGADSFLFVTLGWRPAEFELIARGYGGAERSASFRAVPQPFACLEAD